MQVAFLILTSYISTLKENHCPHLFPKKTPLVLHWLVENIEVNSPNPNILFKQNIIGGTTSDTPRKFWQFFFLQKSVFDGKLKIRKRCLGWISWLQTS